MNSWQKVRARRRFHLFGIVASSAGLIAAIYYWSPEAIDRISSVVLGQTSHQPYVARAEGTGASLPAKKPAKRVRNWVSPKATEASEPAPVRILQKPTERVKVDPHANVKSDAAEVYSSNSPNSSVVQTLKKGDQVETDLEILDSHGRWTLIRTNQVKKSGFVRSENLERPAPNAVKDSLSDPTACSGGSH